MFAPLRLVYGLRPQASPGLLAAALVAGTMFVSTPFLLPELVEHFDVSLGAAGLISTAQVGSFAIASFVAGRRLHPSKRTLIGASVALVVTTWRAPSRRGSGCSLRCGSEPASARD